MTNNYIQQYIYKIAFCVFFLNSDCGVDDCKPWKLVLNKATVTSRIFHFNYLYQVFKTSIKSFFDFANHYYLLICVKTKFWKSKNTVYWPFLAQNSYFVRRSVPKKLENN